MAILLGFVSPLSAQEAPDSWIDAGWQHLQQTGKRQQRWQESIDIWQQGVEQIAADRVLLSPIGLYIMPQHAFKAVNRLGSEMRGIVLLGRFHGKQRYFVLSVPPAKQLESFRTHFEQLISGGKHRVYGWAAARFQHGGSLALPINASDSHAGATTLPPATIRVQAPSSRPPHLSAEELAQRLLLQAKAARAAGDNTKAITFLTTLLKRTPEHAQARLMAGKLMIKTGQYNAAWQVMRPLLKTESVDWKPWYWSGTAELLAGQLQAAATQLDGALARDGKVAEVWVHRALVAQQRGRFKVAYQLLQVAEALAPKADQVVLNIAFTLDALGKNKAASNYYRRYLVQTAGASSQWKARKAVLVRLAELHP